MSDVRQRLATYVAEPDLTGPRMRLGVVWFLALIVAYLLGAFAIALLFGLVVGVAALQTAAAWRRHRVAVNQLVAGVGAALAPLAAWFGHRVLGGVLILLALAAVALGPETSLPRAVPRGEQLAANLEAASATLRSGLFFGLAGAAAVATAQVDPMAFIFLTSMVCVFDAGDYLMGAGYESRLAGPIGGIVGILFAALALAQLPPAPFTARSTLVVGLLCAIACPLGQLLGSWILPRPRMAAPAARRLDGWLLAAPVVAISATLVS